MADIPQSKDEFKIGDTVYFYNYNSEPTSTIRQWDRIQSGIVTKLTPQFCYVDLNNGNNSRKKKTNLFLNRDKAEVLFFKFFDERFKEDFNVSVFDLVNVFKKQSEKYPELFI